MAVRICKSTSHDCPCRMQSSVCLSTPHRLLKPVAQVTCTVMGCDISSALSSCLLSMLDVGPASVPSRCLHSAATASNHKSCCSVQLWTSTQHAALDNFSAKGSITMLFLKSQPEHIHVHKVCRHLVDAISRFASKHSTFYAQASVACGVLQDGVGGKLHLFVSSLPKLGLHGLTPRQGSPSNNSQQKQSVLQPAHKGFQTMAEDAAEHQVCSFAWFALQLP